MDEEPVEEDQKKRQIDLTRAPEKKPYSKFQTNKSEDAVQELKLAKETRNCFIPNGSKVDEKSLECYRETRARINDELPVSFHQVEDWYKLIVRIVIEIIDAL